MAITSAQFPVREPLADRSTGLVRDPWRIWFRNLLTVQQAQPVVTTPVVSLMGKSASVALAAFNTGTLAIGNYRLSYYITVATAAGVSSSLTVTASWTDHSVAQTRTSAAMTGNTTATNQSEIWPIHIDAASPVSYTLTYASNPASAMVYNAYIILETVAI
jgi:hypothetical protein